MADHTSIHPSESLPFPPLYRLQMQGQRTSLFQNSSVSRLGQYGDGSSLICEQTDGAGAGMNRVDDQIPPAYWDLESSVTAQPIALNRGKPLAGIYEGDWSSGCEQQDSVDEYSGTGGNHQKLDSFSEAFYGRSISRINSNGEPSGYNMPSSNTSPSLPSLSFPLVLSPPPTPLPAPSFSPPKRGPLLAVTQAVSQPQSQLPAEAPLQFFPALNCTSSTLPGHVSTAAWLPLSNDASGNTDVTQHLPQNSSPSSIYPDSVGLHLRHLSATQRNTGNMEISEKPSPLSDCSLQTSPCTPPDPHPMSQSVPKLRLEHDSVTSENNVAWSQIAHSSQTFCPPPHQSLVQAGALRVGEDTKTTVGFQRPFMCLSNAQVQSTPTPIYIGVPFHSILRPGEIREDWENVTLHYTPPPMLNPTRSGTGLYCNLLPSLDNRGLWSEETGHNDQHRHVNIGPEFQAELPDLVENAEFVMWQEEPLREELLWKPWAELEENNVLQEHVENLLDLSTSTAFPGGGANLELALHSLSLCQGNILAALEMLFFSNSPPSRDYHYAGSDVWRLSEQKLFHKAFAIYGKDFSFIHKMVKTKQVSQCVEFYYHSKRLQEKQRKQKEMEKEQQKINTEKNTPTNPVVMSSNVMMNPINVERIIHTPSLATSFPCKQCGKMFYKIKSRNAHMKIHRQQQEDWRDRIHPNNHHNLTQVLQNQTRTLTHPNQFVTQAHQNQILTQSLIQNLVQSQAQLAFLQSSKTQGACFTAAISGGNATPGPQTAPPKAPTLPHYAGHQQTWGALHGSLESGLYYD